MQVTQTGQAHHSLKSLILLKKRPPPKSTLFPYTTLFRSYPAPDVVSAAIYQGGGQAKVAGWGSNLRNQRRSESTRLNSSHPSISYAVFCLKKKKYSARNAVHRILILLELHFVYVEKI